MNWDKTWPGKVIETQPINNKALLYVFCIKMKINFASWAFAWIFSLLI